MADLWVENRHPDYEVEVLKRQYTRDQYTGRALAVAKSESSSMNDDPDGSKPPRAISNFMSEDNLPRGTYRVGYFSGEGSGAPSSNGGYGSYLIRRSQGESASAFAERARITRFPSHMAALVDAYSGGIAAVENGKWNLREEGPLGASDDEGSLMYRMWRDIDGTGLNWLGALNKAKTNVIVDNKFFSFTYLPEGAANPLTEIIDPNRIVDWHMVNGRPTWLLVAEDVLERPDMHEPAEVVRYYTEYDVDGWTKWRISENDGGDDTLEVVDADTWKHKFYTDDTRTVERLPFTYLKFSDRMTREVGYQMAEDHNALYNILSDARWNFRVINHPRLVGDVEDSVFNKGVAGINAGANGLQGDWSYISPDSSNASEAYRTYEAEVKQFYITNHQRMNAPNIERSATEVLFNQAEGRTAFLSLMASAIDEIDNDWRFLGSQIMSPQDESVWHSSTVERSRDFKPVDIENLIQKQVNNYVAASGTGLEPELAALMATDGITKEVRERLEDVEVPEVPIEVPVEVPFEDDKEEETRDIEGQE